MRPLCPAHPSQDWRVCGFSVRWHDKEDGASSTCLWEQLQFCEWGREKGERMEDQKGEGGGDPK